MIIKHQVYLKLKSGVKKDQIEKMYQALEGLQETIPTILNFERIQNTSNERNRTHGYTHGFIMNFEGKKVLADYLKHPDHVRVAREHVLKIAEPLVFDYQSFE